LPFLDAREPDEQLETIVVGCARLDIACGAPDVRPTPSPDTRHGLSLVNADHDRPIAFDDGRSRPARWSFNPFHDGATDGT
jgi:hypothetical protein